MGKHGIKLSEISIGTMYYGSYISKENGIKCLNEALNQGINYIDSANRYGIKDNDLPSDKVIRAESVIGEFLKNHERSDLVLSSKLHHHVRDDINAGGLSRKHILEEIQISLKHLGTEYIDLYFCHRPDRETPIEETIRAMTYLVDEGLVNYWGTSWHPPHYVERMIGIAKENGLIPPSVEQPPYHMRARFIENDLFDVAKYHGLGITSFEALNSGLFTGKYNESIPEDSRFNTIERLDSKQYEGFRSKLIKIQEVADSIEMPMNHLAFAFVLSHPEVSSAIMGARTVDQVKSNANASGLTLSNDIINQLNEINSDRTPRWDYR